MIKQYDGPTNRDFVYGYIYSIDVMTTTDSEHIRIRYLSPTGEIRTRLYSTQQDFIEHWKPVNKENL